jgi:hypothetical protein
MKYRILNAAVRLAESCPDKYNAGKHCSLVISTRFNPPPTVVSAHVVKSRITLGGFLDRGFTSDLYGFILVECMRNHPEVWDELPSKLSISVAVSYILESKTVEREILDGLVDSPVKRGLMTDKDVAEYLETHTPRAILQRFNDAMMRI